MQFQKGQSGNPAGRPRGARNKLSLLAESRFAEEGGALLDMLIKVAKTGDVAALRLCIDRICPPQRDRPVAIELPEMKTAADAVGAIGAIMAAIGAGDLGVHEAAELTNVVTGFSQTIIAAQLERRLGRGRDGGSAIETGMTHRTPSARTSSFVGPIRGSNPASLRPNRIRASLIHLLASQAETIDQRRARGGADEANGEVPGYTCRVMVVMGFAALVAGQELGLLFTVVRVAEDLEVMDVVQIVPPDMDRRDVLILGAARNGEIRGFRKERTTGGERGRSADRRQQPVLLR